MSHVHFVRRSKLFHFHFQINKTDKIDIDTYYRWLVEIIQIHWFFPSNILLHHYKTYRIIQITYFHENNNKMHMKATTKKNVLICCFKKKPSNQIYYLRTEHNFFINRCQKSRDVFIFHSLEMCLSCGF